MNSSRYLSSTVHEYFGAPLVNVDVGLEIEAEVRREGRGALSYWDRTHDGSLRGNNYELVLKNPIALKEVPIALTEAYSFLDRVQYKDTQNCGVHVHINMTNRTIKQTCYVISMLMLLEPLLVSYCGKYREGNYFCLSALDAQEQFVALNYMATGNTRSALKGLKYSGINITPLSSFGTIEIRHLEFPAPMEKIQKWVDILFEIRDNALKLTSSRDGDMIFRRISEMGIEDFVREYAPTLFEETVITNKISKDMMLSMRKLQIPIYNMLAFEKKKKPLRRRLGSL